MTARWDDVLSLGRDAGASATAATGA